MERYLTEKAKPQRTVVTLEKLALIALFLLLAACVYVAVYGYMRDGLSFGHLLLCIPAVLLVLAMNPIAERIRARKHAQLIVKALLKAEGSLPSEELEDACGVRRGADVAMKLVNIGYLRDIRMQRELIGFSDVLPAEPPKEEIVPIFRN